MPEIKWGGKDDIKHHHKKVEYKLIECKEVVGDSESENLIIKGDNLLALKSLLPYYANRVKMIYIDPPYNTGNTSWVYNDNVDSETIKKWLNKNVVAEDLNRSDKWLCMMTPRLKLLRELLREDGVIFISIDDAEVAHLRMLCDEIFGRENFVANLIWQHSIQPKGYIDKVSIHHNYTLVYSKSLSFKLNEQNRTDEHNKNYSNPDNDPRGFWRSGDVRNALYRPNLIYDIVTPNGKIIYPPTNGWRWSKETLKLKIKSGEIIFNEDETRIIRKIYLDNVNGRAFESIMFGKEFGTTRDASTELKEIFNNKLFDTPKPTRLIQKLLQIATQENDIILDSFAGSGTTAHAVLEQNKLDGGNRKFILIEMEEYAKEITAERVKRVINGYSYKGNEKTKLFEKKLTTTDILNIEKMQKLNSEVDEVIEGNKNEFDKIEKSFKDSILEIFGIKNIDSFKSGIGGGFKYCELGENVFDEFGNLNHDLSFEIIAKHLHFIEFKKPLSCGDFKEPFISKYNQTYLFFFRDKFNRSDFVKLKNELNSYQKIVIYTQKSTISKDEASRENIEIRYIPFDIKER